MRIGLAQISSRAGDLAGNRERIIATYRELIARGAELVVFPELALCGLPPWHSNANARFAADVESVLLEVAAASGPVPMLVGALDQNTDPQGRPFFNAAAFCHDGAVQGFARKVHGANDEAFEAETRATVFEIEGRRVGVTFGDDLAGPEIAPLSVDLVAEFEQKHVDLVICLRASPAGGRWQLAMDRVAQRLGVTIISVDAGGDSGSLSYVDVE